MSEIDADLADKVLQKNVSNIVAKAKRGVPLSKSELETVKGLRPEEGKPVAIFDSITSAAAALSKMGHHVSVALLKKFKGQGASGFRNSRVYMDEFLPWLKNHHGNSVGLPPDKASLEIRRLAAQCERLERQNSIEAGKLLDKSVYIGIHQRILGPLDNLIEQKLVNEWPAAVAGLDIPSAREYGKKLSDDIRSGFRELLTQLPP